MINPIPSTWLSECLTRIRGARVGVFGDFRLDAHWWTESDNASQRITRQVYGPGGAGNIAANLASLGANAVHTVGLLGDDMFAKQLLELLQASQVRTDGLMKIQRDWQTEALALTHQPGLSPRSFEFGSCNAATEISLDRLAEAVDRMAGWCDVIVVHQHAPDGVCPAAMIHRLNAVIARHARCRFIVDARHRATQFKGAMLRLSVPEAAGACAMEAPTGTDDTDLARSAAVKLFQLTRQTVFVAQGTRGLLVSDATGLHENPLPPATGGVEAATSQETATAAVAAVLAGGGDALSAARLANLAARATLHKNEPPVTVTPDQVRQTLTGYSSRT